VKEMDNSTLAPKKYIRELERRSLMGDRRKLPAKGFARISTVGWICRREQTRRKDDKLDYFYEDK
jgi:hypothetical protein